MAVVGHARSYAKAPLHMRRGKLHMGLCRYSCYWRHHYTGGLPSGYPTGPYGCGPLLNCPGTAPTRRLIVGLDYCHRMVRGEALA